MRSYSRSLNTNRQMDSPDESSKRIEPNKVVALANGNGKMRLLTSHEYTNVQWMPKRNKMT
eukprot:scaffold15313_cov39-Cyclotella_meneghiniana.AAC.5